MYGSPSHPAATSGGSGSAALRKPKPTTAPPAPRAPLDAAARVEPQREPPDSGRHALADTGEPALSEALDRARAGDEAGFVTLYRALAPGLHRYATALVGWDAEDATAEAWLQIARDIRAFDGDLDGFRGWAARITRNRAMDVLRSRRRGPAAPDGLAVLAGMPGPHDTPAAALDAISTGQAIALIATLPADQAEAVLLRAVVGLDAKTAGQVLGKRAGAVRVAAHRGLRQLARQLGALRAEPATEAGGTDE